MKTLIYVLVEKTLPEDVPPEYRHALREYSGSLLGFIRQALAILVEAYRVEVVEAFDRYGLAVHMGLTIVCFGASSMPWSMFFLLTPVMCAIVLRDAFTKRKVDSISQYAVYSGGDAVTSLVFLLVTEALLFGIAPSASLPVPVLVRGATILLPLQAILRMVMRPMPPMKRYEGTPLSAKAIAKEVVWLNMLWAFAVWGIVLINASDVPHSLMDWFRGWSIYLVVLRAMVARNTLNRRTKIQTLKSDPEKLDLKSLKEVLPQDLKRGDPFYWLARMLDVVIFGGLGISLMQTLWPWLSGHPEPGGVLRPLFVIVAFGTVVLSWRYVKQANQTAAELLQKEIDERAKQEALVKGRIA